MKVKELDKIYKKNIIFIIMIGIVGLSFGFLDWDANLSDLVYMKYHNKVLISIISANIGTSRLLASIFCIKINDSKRPNYVFNICMISCSVVVILTSIIFKLEFIGLFAVIYLFLHVLLEIFSGYHYAYAYNSLPEEQAMNAHSKRISVFKITEAIGIAIAAYICTKYIDNAFLILAILSTIVFVVSMFFVSRVKNFPKNNEKEKVKLIKKLNIFNYSKYFKKWLVVRTIGRFAHSSMVVLLSLMVIDNNMSVPILKTSKSILWILSGIGFFLSGYFIKKKVIVKGDIILKGLIAIILPFIFVCPNLIFLIIILAGVLEPFNNMSHLQMLRKDNDNINLAQKDMVINLVGYFSKMLSAYILLNINNVLAIFIMSVLLIISVIFEYILYKTPVTK